MATYFVNSGAGGADTGGSWTDAYLTYAQAVTAATTAGDLIKVHVGHTDVLSADTTYTFTANVRTICVDKDNSDALAIMGVASGYIGHTSSSFAITFAGAFSVYIYGLTLRISGTTTRNLIVNNTDGGHFELEQCYLWQGTTSASAGLRINPQTSGANGYCKIINCTFIFGHTSQSIAPAGVVDIVGGSISSSSSAITTIIVPGVSAVSSNIVGFDATNAGAAYLLGNCTGSSYVVNYTKCKLPASYSLLNPQTITNKSAGTINVYDCSDGDQHYKIGYADAFGELSVSTGIYANDGASYDGTNRYSWVITTTAYCSTYTPFITPWIEKYHSDTSAITPYIEILRDGSATAYQDDEVWAEFACKTTASSTLASVSNDRTLILGTPANQTTGVGASGWTGENATAWFGKCVAPASITPAEIGMLMARLVVGEPSITVYADPTIRT